MGVIDDDGEWSGPCSMARISVRFLGRWTWSRRLRLVFRSSSDVSVTVRLMLRFMVSHG